MVRLRKSGNYQKRNKKPVRLGETKSKILEKNRLRTWRARKKSRTVLIVMRWVSIERGKVSLIFETR